MVPKKQLYRVKLEVMAPVELNYRIWAETPEQAVELIKTAQLSEPPKPILSKRRNIKATVYKHGMLIIEFVKNFI